MKESREWCIWEYFGEVMGGRNADYNHKNKVAKVLKNDEVFAKRANLLPLSSSVGD